MQIDIVSNVSPKGAPAMESTGPFPEAPGKGRGSFAALLDAVSDAPADSTPSDQGDDEVADEWMTVPVFVPFVPVIPPQDVTKSDEGSATAVEAADDEASSIAATVSVSDTAISQVATQSVRQDGAPSGAKAEQPQASIAIGEPADPQRPVIEQRRSQRPREIPVVPFETVKDANTGVVGPVAEEPAAKKPEAKISDAVTPEVTTTDAKTAKAANPVSTPKMPAETDAATSTAAQEIAKAVAAQEGATAKGVAPAESTNKGIAINEPGPGSRGTAVRLARALRIVEGPMLQGAPATTGENTPAFTQSDNGQSSFGEWFREQLPQAVVNGRTQVPAQTFNLVAPLPHDSRVGETLAVAGGTVAPDTSIAPGEHDVTLQLVQSLRMQFRDGIGEAVLKLKPEHLGSVSITLKVENGGLKASVQADMPAVRQWLESQQDTLRNALADHGLRLDQFDVEPDGQRQAQSEDAEREPTPRRRQARRLPPVDQPVFEVVV